MVPPWPGPPPFTIEALRTFLWNRCRRPYDSYVGEGRNLREAWSQILSHAQGDGWDGHLLAAIHRELPRDAEVARLFDEVKPAPVVDPPPFDSLRDELLAYLSARGTDRQDWIADFCRQELDGHRAGWRSIKVVAWGHAHADAAALTSRLPRDPCDLAPGDFATLAGLMQTEDWRIGWSLDELERRAAIGGIADEVVACDDSHGRFYLLSTLGGLVATIRRVWDDVVAGRRGI